MNNCSDPGCPYRALYEGAQESLKSMTARQSQNLDRVNRVRSGVISSMKSSQPRLFSQIESEMPARMRDVDDRMLLLAVEEMLRRLNSPAPDMDPLRKVLEEHGFALPGSDDPSAWADALVDQQPRTTTVTPPVTDAITTPVAPTPVDTQFPSPPNAARTLLVEPTPDPQALAPSAEPVEEVIDFGDPGGLDELFSEFDPVDSTALTDDDDWLAEFDTSDEEQPQPEPVTESTASASDVMSADPAPAALGDDLAELFADLPDADTTVVSGDVDDFDELFADLPDLDDEPVVLVSNDFDELFAAQPDTEPAPPPVTVRPPAPSPEPFFPDPSSPLRPMSAPHGNTKSEPSAPPKRKRSRSVTAVRPGTDTATPVVTPVTLTTRQARELDALLSQPRPVFFSEIEQLLTQPTADAWYDNLKANRRGGDKTLAYVVGKARFSKDTGPLIMRDEGHESELQKNDESGWREIRQNYRAHHLYAAAHVFWRLRDQILTTDVDSRVFAMIVRPPHEPAYGLVVAVGDDFKPNSEMNSQIDAQVTRLARSNLDHITVVTTAGTKSIYQSMVSAIDSMSKQWTFTIPVRVGYSHEVSTRGMQEEIYPSADR